MENLRPVKEVALIEASASALVALTQGLSFCVRWRTHLL